MPPLEALALAFIKADNGKVNYHRQSRWLAVAGPSKGPDRNRKCRMTGNPTDGFITGEKSRHTPSCTAQIAKKIFPELSNFGSPPAEPGVYFMELEVARTYLKKNEAK